MNKQTIIGLILIIGIFVGYMWWIAPSKEEQAAMRARYDSMMQAYNDSVQEAEALALQKAELERAAAAGDSVAMQLLNERPAASRDMGAFTAAAEGEELQMAVDNGLMQIEFSNQGAEIRRVVLSEYVTYDSMPLQLINPDEESNMNLIFTTRNNRKVETKDLVFQPYIDNECLQGHQSRKLEDGESLVLSYRAYVTPDSGTSAADSYLEYQYTVTGGSYEVGFDILFHELDAYVGSTPYMDFVWKNRLNRQEKVNQGAQGSRNRNRDPERYYTNLYFKPSKDNVDNLRLGTSSKQQVKTAVDWIAYKQQFFCAILTADSLPFENADLAVSQNGEGAGKDYLVDMSSTIGMPYEGGNSAMNMHFYFGPTKYRALRAMGKGFEKMLPLGWWVFSKFVSRYFIIPVFNFLEHFNWNYGIIIIVMTLLLRLVLSPLTFKSYQSSAVMRILKPEMDAINKRYPNQDQALQKQQAMSQLQKRAGISPLAGCFPALIQLPVWTAMFWFYPVSIELRQKHFLWCDDLSSYDSILNFGFNIPLYGDHISLFCLLMFAMQLFYTWYTMRNQTQQAGMPGMKAAMYFMPFMLLFVFNSQSAALNIYQFCSISITMLQMILIRRFTSESKVRARMMAYDAKSQKKPQKKSRFQQMMQQEMERQRKLQQQQSRKN